MRAITQTQFGGPEVLTVVTDAADPEPGPMEVQIRTAAIGLNPLETRVRSGEFPLIGQPPFILGWDVSGTVAVSNSWRFDVGDEVLGMVRFPHAGDAYAELVTAPAVQLVRKPASVSHEEAAALPIVGLTAWQGLVDIARIGAGDRVLVLGGGGGVGHVAIQIAKARGAHVVATASASKSAFVEGLGADEVVDYANTDVVSVVEPVDVVLDTVGGTAVHDAVATVRPGGLLVTAVADEDEDLAAACEAAGIRFRGIGVDPDREALQALVDLVEQGRMRVHLQETFDFEHVADAHRLMESGHLQGKLVLLP